MSKVKLYEITSRYVSVPALQDTLVVGKASESLSSATCNQPVDFGMVTSEVVKILELKQTARVPPHLALEVKEQLEKDGFTVTYSEAVLQYGCIELNAVKRIAVAGIDTDYHAAMIHPKLQEISRLTSEVTAVRDRLDSLNRLLIHAEFERDTLLEDISYYNHLPWWKRIFKRVKATI